MAQRAQGIWVVQGHIGGKADVVWVPLALKEAHFGPVSPAVAIVQQKWVVAAFALCVLSSLSAVL